MEARQHRRDDECDRRNLQQRVRQVLKIGEEKRQIAKYISKQHLKNFKRDTLQTLQDLGALRSKKEYSMGTHFIPQLYNQAELEMAETNTRTQIVEQSLRSSLAIRANKHKNAILTEMQRREDLKNEKIRKEEEAKKAKERRQERRKCLKEQKRINEIQDVLITNVIPVAEQRDFSIQIPIFDIRDYNAEAPNGIYTYGGFLGELIVSLFCLQTNALQKPENIGFKIEADMIDSFLRDFFVDGFNPGTAYLRVTSESCEVDEHDSIEKKSD